MTTIDVQQAKEQLSDLLDRVAEGEEIVIVRSGRPVAKLVNLPRPQRKPGRHKGRIHIGPEFDDPLPDEMAAAFGATPIGVNSEAKSS